MVKSASASRICEAAIETRIATAEPNVNTYYTLSSGNTGLMRNEFSTGEAANFGASLFLSGMLILLVFLQLVRRK